MENLIPSSREGLEPEPELEEAAAAAERLMPSSSGADDLDPASAPVVAGTGCPYAATVHRAEHGVADELSIVFEAPGNLGLGFNHSDTDPAIVVSVVPASLAAGAGVRPGMVLCRVATKEVGSLSCSVVLEVLRKRAPVRPLELGFAWPHTERHQDEVEGVELSSAQQLRDAWDAILAAEVPADAPIHWPERKQIHAGVVQTDTSAMISCPVDFVPQDTENPQLICPNGAVCRATISWFSNDYSGLFSAGPAPVEGLLRLSSALEPVSLSGWNPMSLAIGSIAKSKLFPCAAFKAYRGSSIHSGVHACFPIHHRAAAAAAAAAAAVIVCRSWCFNLIKTIQPSDVTWG
eukprot:COSAG02_NODE_1535_length_12053_cov_13.122794_9_plen_348_part_00